MDIHASSDPSRNIDDYYFEHLEKEYGSMWLMEKIFTLGNVEDIRAIRKYYGDERIKKEVVNIRWLSKETLSFLSGIFEMPREEFLTWKPINANNYI